MAFNDPTTTHVDDWTQFLHSVNGGLPEAKTSHLSPPLTTNQLQDSYYGTYARRFTAASSVSGTNRYMIKSSQNPNFVNDSAASVIEIAFRNSDVRFPMVVLLSKYNSLSSFYSISISNQLLQIGGGGRTVNEDFWGLSGFSTGGVIARAASSVASYAGDWAAMRLKSVREGDDMRLRAYYVTGYADVDTLDANDEPDWGSPLIDVYHRNGSTTPDIIVGTSVNNFGTTTPIYAGDYGFVVTNVGTNGISVDTWIDSPRAKRMA